MVVCEGRTEAEHAVHAAYIEDEGSFAAHGVVCVRVAAAEGIAWALCGGFGAFGAQTSGTPDELGRNAAGARLLDVVLYGGEAGVVAATVPLVTASVDAVGDGEVLELLG